MGLGDIYINLKGREGQGIVKPGAEYEALIAEIRSKLARYVDEETGEHPVAYVFTRDEAYGTYDPALIPDLFASNAVGVPRRLAGHAGHRRQVVVEPNLDVWSADHCSVYPPLVDGDPVRNRRLDRRRTAVHGRHHADPARALRRAAHGGARRQESRPRRDPGQPGSLEPPR